MQIALSPTRHASMMLTILSHNKTEPSLSENTESFTHQLIARERWCSGEEAGWCVTQNRELRFGTRTPKCTNRYRSKLQHKETWCCITITACGGRTAYSSRGCHFLPSWRRNEALAGGWRKAAACDNFRLSVLHHGGVQVFFCFTCWRTVEDTPPQRSPLNSAP